MLRRKLGKFYIVLLYKEKVLFTISDALFLGAIPPSPPQTESADSSPDEKNMESPASNIRFHVTVEEGDDDSDVYMRTASNEM